MPPSPSPSPSGGKKKMADAGLRLCTSSSEQDLLPNKKIKKTLKHWAGTEDASTCPAVSCSKRRRQLVTEEETLLLPPEKKKKQKKTEAANCLCDEVCMEILARLPTKSLSRFRCVSTSWCSVFSSHHFVELHLSRANRQNRSFLFSPLDLSECEFIKLCSLHPTRCAPDPILEVSNLRSDRLCLLKKPCRGLNLMFSNSVEQFSIFVCNPGTREFMELPDGYLCAVFHNVGLGFDHNRKEYKVVRLFYRQRDLMSREYSMGCQIYTLGSRYGWRSTQDPPYPINNIQPAFVNGCLHWVIDAQFLRLNYQALLAFNIGDESFSIVPFPPCCCGDAATKGMHIVELEACLCIVTGGQCSAVMDIWMLKDYQARVWNRIYCINLQKLPGHSLGLQQYIFPLLVEDGKIILAIQEKKIGPHRLRETIDIYDPVTETIEHLLTSPDIMCRHDDRLPFFRCAVYEESVVPIGTTYEEILASEEKYKIMVEILLKLPLESILRFKDVSKSLRALISSNYFTDLHLEQATKTKSPEILLLFNRSTFLLSYRSKFIPLEKFDPVVVEQMVDGLQDPEELEKTAIDCSKHCHGLNLLCVRGESFSFIWNPLLDIYANWRALYSTIDDENIDRATFVQYMGLGYNRDRKEHVVVNLFYRWRSFETRTYSMGCMVYTVNVSKFSEKWRSVSPPPYPVSDMPPASIGESLYWMSEPQLCDRSSPRVILAFDVVDEVFRVVPTPSCDSNFSRTSNDVFLVELKGLLCVVDANQSMNRMDIWMSKDGSWTREYQICLENWPNFSLKRARVIPMYARKEDGRILLYTGRELGYYDSKSDTLETVFSLDSAFGERYHHLCKKITGFSVVLAVENLANCYGRRCVREF